MLDLKRMEAKIFFETVVKKKPRLNELKRMYLIRREFSKHVNTK